MQWRITYARSTGLQERGRTRWSWSYEKRLPHTNFTKIEQSAAELWAKTIFSTRHFEFYKVIFGHVSVIMCCCVPNFITSDDFSSRYGDLTICNTAAVRHFLIAESWSLCHVTSIAMRLWFPMQNFTEIGLSAAKWWPKTIYKKAAVHHLEFLKMFIFGRLAVIDFQNVLLCAKFHQNLMICDSINQSIRKIFNVSRITNVIARSTET